MARMSFEIANKHAIYLIVFVFLAIGAVYTQAAFVNTAKGYHNLQQVAVGTGTAPTTSVDSISADGTEGSDGVIDDSNKLGGVLSSGWQRRVSGICPSGEAIREINEDGTVACQSTTTAGGEMLDERGRCVKFQAPPTGGVAGSYQLSLLVEGENICRDGYGCEIAYWAIDPNSKDNMIHEEGKVFFMINNWYSRYQIGGIDADGKKEVIYDFQYSNLCAIYDDSGAGDTYLNHLYITYNGNRHCIVTVCD